MKVVLDQAGGDTLYFQNSQKYEIHYDFVSEHLSGGDLPLVPALSSFNASEYYTPDRRFILGAVTHYDGPDVWAFELSPYDTATHRDDREGLRAGARVRVLRPGARRSTRPRRPSRLRPTKLARASEDQDHGRALRGHRLPAAHARYAPSGACTSPSPQTSRTSTWPTRTSWCWTRPRTTSRWSPGSSPKSSRRRSRT